MNPVSPRQFVYILQNKEGKFYTGCTNNLERRLAEHKSGKGGYTKNKGPYTLVYYEYCLNKNDAYRRERYLKTGMGKKYLKNRIKLYLERKED